MYVALMSVVLFSSKRIRFQWASALGFILLGLSSSRVSIFVATIGCAAIIYSRLSKKRERATLSRARQIVFTVVLTIPLLAEVILNNRTLTGRTINYASNIALWREKPWFGQGIVGYGTENSLITTLVTTGIFGAIFLVFLLISLSQLIRGTNPERKLVANAYFLACIIGSSGETLISSMGYNAGALYIAMIMVMATNIKKQPISIEENDALKK